MSDTAPGGEDPPEEPTKVTIRLEPYIDRGGTVVSKIIDPKVPLLPWQEEKGWPDPG